jgi:aminopeptidase N
MPVVAQDGLAFGWAMERLELELDLDHERGSLEGHASYHLRNESGEPISEVSFNLGRLMTVRAVRDADGQSLPFMQDVVLFADDARRQVNHILVALPEARAPGEVVELRLEYGGYLVGYRETGSVYIQDRVVWNAVVRYLDDGRFSILRTDAFAWPVPGTLNAGANRAAPRPDFSYRAAITVPDSFIVATGGALVERTTREGRTTFVYESTAPVPFLNLPIAEYVERSSDGIRVYHFRADSIGGQRVLDRTVAGLDLLAEWFGPLRSTPKLAVMEIPEMWGSQASLTAGVILTADAFSETGSLVPLYHELTHLWNPRDVDLPSARWNEGLATFLQLRMAQDLDSFDAMEGTIRRFADGIVASGDRTPDITTVPFARYGAAGRTDLSYRVGALMFHALYSNMGSDAFDAAFREYYQTHRDDGGTFDGLLEAFQAHSAVDLSGFFDTWVRTTAWYDQLAAGTPHERVGIQEGR